MTSIQKLYSLFKDSKGVQTDTRKLKEGEMFFALQGDNFNGNLYAEQAISNGASCAIVSDPELAKNDYCYLVSDTLQALQEMAKHHRLQFHIPFLAITGSNGKTTTKELLACVLSKKYDVLATKGNFNNHIGVPLTLLSIKEEHNFAIIEMGANHQKEIASYCQWALPNFGLINNCGKAHLEGFGGIEGVRKGKGELYDFIADKDGTIFINADYDYLANMAINVNKQITYGEFAGEYRAKIYEHEPFLKVANLGAGTEQLISTNLVGDYNLANIQAAIAVGKYFGVSDNEISDAIGTYTPTNNRSEHKEVKGINIILDAYNANPSSMKAALDSFDKMSHANKIVMLGAMMELGDTSAMEHQEILTYAKQKNLKQVIVVGKEFEASANNNGVLYFENATSAKEWFWENVSKEDWVYIKGSRLTAMEKIIELND